MPLLLTIGPMLTMAIVSGVNFVNVISGVTSGEKTLQQSLPRLFTTGAMLMSMLLWTMLTKKFNKKLKQRKQIELIQKYTKYLNEKKNELIDIKNFREDIKVREASDLKL